MSLFVQKSIKLNPGQDPYCFAANSKRGGIKITAAGASGTISLYKKINGVSVLVVQKPITCNPATNIEEIIGSDIEFIIQVDSTDCVQLLAVDVNAALVNAGQINLGDVTVNTTPQSDGSGDFYADSNGDPIWINVVYDEATGNFSYKRRDGSDAGQPEVNFFTLSTTVTSGNYNTPEFEIITNDTKTYPSDSINSITFSVDGPGVTIDIDGAGAQALPSGANMTWGADELIDKSIVFVAPAGTSIYSWTMS